MAEALLQAALEWREQILAVSNMLRNPWAAALLLMNEEELIIEYALFLEEARSLIQEENMRIPQLT